MAIKTVEGKFNGRFEREAKTMASLNHQLICKLHDVNENYLVIELSRAAGEGGGSRWRKW